MGENSIINIGELSKPATVLIEKISDAVGGVFKPYQIVRVAKAEAEADRVRAESQIEISDLQRRAFQRFLEEEAKKQSNIEEITQQSLPLLTEQAEPDKVEDDWITNFFDRCRLISDQEMRGLWSRVLAGEANSPGSFSKKTVNFLSDLDKRDADLFTKLCGFGWMIGNVVPLIYRHQNGLYDFYTQHGINFDSLSHLENIGLIKYDNLLGFFRTNLPKKFNVFYYGTPIELEMPEKPDNSMSIGQVLLTKTGHELAPICGSSPIEGFLSFVRDKWKELKYIKEDKDEEGAIVTKS